MFQQHILLVEDIVDTGKSAVAVTAAIKAHNPASVRFATLLIKKTPLRNNFRPDCEYHNPAFSPPSSSRYD